MLKQILIRIYNKKMYKKIYTPIVNNRNGIQFAISKKREK